MMAAEERHDTYNKKDKQSFDNMGQTDINKQNQIDVRLENDMIWLTREQIAVLFGRDYKTISKHINNALREELADSVVIAKFANTTLHGAIKGKCRPTFINKNN